MDIKLVAAAAFTFVLSSNINASTIVINEFLPNAIGSDSGNEWIEIFNAGANTISLGNWEIQKATSSYSSVFVFPSETSLASGAYIVVGGRNILEADLTTHQLSFGNASSSGDAVRLLDSFSNVIDTVIYGPNNNDGFLNDISDVALNYANTPNAGQSLGRRIDGSDTHNSKHDFSVFDNQTLGAPNNVSAVPVPAAAWLFGSGLIGLIGIARRENKI